MGEETDRGATGLMEAAIAAAGIPGEFGKALLGGLLPSLGSRAWLSESESALGELEPIIVAALAHSAASASTKSPTRRAEEAGRPGGAWPLPTTARA